MFSIHEILCKTLRDRGKKVRKIEKRSRCEKNGAMGIATNFNGKVSERIKGRSMYIGFSKKQNNFILIEQI